MTTRMLLRLQYLELDELPGTSARRRFLLVIYMSIFAALFLFAVTFFDLALTSGGHLRTPLLDWLFNTPLGMLACIMLAFLVVELPIMALQWRSGLLRVQLAQAPDMTDALPDAWEEVSVRRPIERQAGVLIGKERRERRVNRLLLILALGLALALLATWVASIIYMLHTALAERCDSRPCVPYVTPIMSGGSVVFAVSAMTLIAQNIWIARVERAGGIWLRHRRAVVNGSSLCYIRKPGVGAEQATQAIQRFARAGRRPAAPGCLITLLAYVPFILLIPTLIVLSAWLGTR